METTKDTCAITISNLPTEVRELMKERARRNYRSANQQYILDLTEIANQEYAQQQADSETSRG